MTFNALSRQLTVLSESARRMRARHTLTAAERRNLRAAGIGSAVYTASMGGHPRYR